MRRRVIIAAMCLACRPLAGVAGEFPEEVEVYRGALDALQGPARAATVEQLFTRGLEAGRSLVAVDAPGGATMLETLGEAAFQSVVVRMQGFTVTRGEAVQVAPDPGFFLALARRLGSEADVQFFEAYRETMRASGWPTYVEPQTDYTGCTKYGSLGLVEGYRRWTGYRLRFADRYAARVGEIIREIEAQLAGGTCACGTRASVVSELRAFVDAFPGDPMVPSLQERMRAIEAGTSAIRFVCVAG